MATLKNLTTLALAGLMGLGLAAQASADPIADFYKGKRIQMLVGSSPGGGYDTYARLVTRHMGRYIPGHPRWIVKNMPGAAGTPGPMVKGRPMVLAA